MNQHTRRLDRLEAHIGTTDIDMLLYRLADEVGVDPDDLMDEAMHLEYRYAGLDGEALIMAVAEDAARETGEDSEAIAADIRARFREEGI